MNILGVSAFYHDSAACLVRDGEIIAAAQEERFSRLKHDPSFPSEAVKYCLKEAGLKSSGQLDFVVFYDKPFLKLERILTTYLSYAPRGLGSFVKSMPAWIKQKIWIKEIIRRELDFEGTILFTKHHEAHAASAFFPSPYDRAAILTVDGVGEWPTTSFGAGEHNKIVPIAELNFPHSLGLLYSAFTYYTGFKVNSGEYKMMGLAPYGEPRYADLILRELVDLKNDGSFRLNMKYFDFAAGLKMTNGKFDALFQSSPRKPDEPVSQSYMDMAASIQKVTEEIMLKIIRHVHRITGRRKLCLAGGVALNCVANGKILREGPFDDIWIQPAAGDAGGALGAALSVWYQYLDNARQPRAGDDCQKRSYLGPAYGDRDIARSLKRQGAVFGKLRPDELVEKVAGLIAEGKVVGWFQGRMEFGPRALGARSILGDARNEEMQARMNMKIKFRESFRPFAPSVLESRAADFFDIDRRSPYMLLTVFVKNNHRTRNRSSLDRARGLEKMKVVRSDLPAVTHVDYSARIQSVSHNSHPLYHKLIKQFDDKYHCPVIINTSFNVRGEPIVCTPRDAFLCFMRTDMDCLAIGNYLLYKEEQLVSADRVCVKNYPSH